MLQACEIPGRARTARLAEAARFVGMLPQCCFLPGRGGGCKDCFPLAAASPPYISVYNKAVYQSALGC